MSTTKRFYGIRFLGGNRTCTTGTPNENTGRMSIACDVQVFRTKTERDKWVNNEKISEPSGCGGGERIACSLSEARNYNLGISVEDFEADLDSSYGQRYDYDDER